MPTGTRYWVEGNIMWLAASNNQSLLNEQLYVQMPSARTSDVTAPMNVPDDALESIFNDVVTQLTKRYQEPKDIINDDIGAGVNNVNTKNV